MIYTIETKDYEGSTLQMATDEFQKVADWVKNFVERHDGFDRTITVSSWLDGEQAEHSYNCETRSCWHYSSKHFDVVNLLEEIEDKMTAIAEKKDLERKINEARQDLLRYGKEYEEKYGTQKYGTNE